MKTFAFLSINLICIIMIVFAIWMYIIWIPTPTWGTIAVIFVACMINWWNYEQYYDRI